MAKLLTKRVISYSLELTESEVTWLRGALQNPLHGETPYEEDTTNAAFRHSIFNAVSPEGIVWLS